MQQFFTILVVLSLALTTAGGVAAQSADELEPTDAPTTKEPCERIDMDTELCSAKLVNGKAVLEIHSTKNQKLTVTDSGKMMAGGEIPTQDFILKKDETTKIRFDVYTDGEFVGVTIATSEVLWGVPLKKSRTFISGPIGVSDLQVVGLTAISMTGLMGIALAFKRRRGYGEEPEQIA